MARPAGAGGDRTRTPSGEPGRILRLRDLPERLDPGPPVLRGRPRHRRRGAAGTHARLSGGRAAIVPTLLTLGTEALTITIGGSCHPSSRPGQLRICGRLISD